MKQRTVTQASLSGPTLAAVSQAAASTTDNFDGLIYGSYRQQTVRSLDDERDDDQELQQEFCISGFHCNAFCGSFYGGAGTLDAQSLQDISQQLPDQLLGWFVCRRGCWHQPTMREQQVTANLMGLQRDQQRVPQVLFMTFLPSRPHGGATFSLEQRLYCMGPDGPLLRPVPLKINNLRSGHTPLQYSQDFGPDRLTDCSWQSAQQSAAHQSPGPNSQDSHHQSDGPAPVGAMTNSIHSMQLPDILDAAPAIAQVAALEAAMEAVMARLDSLAVSSQKQLDSRSAIHQQVTHLIGAQSGT